MSVNLWLLSDSIEGVEDTIQGQLDDTLEETTQAITDKVITPILQSDVNSLENNFDNRLFPFAVRLKAMNMILLSFLRKQHGEYLSNLIAFEYPLFEGIKLNIETKQNIKPEIRTNIIDLAESLRNYDIALTGIAIRNQSELIEALNVVNINELRKYVSGGILALLCALTYLEDQNPDEQKLTKLLVLGKGNTDVMSAFIDSIDILSTKEKRKSTQIEGEIGTITPTGFNVDLNKMDMGRRYTVNYNTSQYKVEKNEKGELVIYEVG